MGRSIADGDAPVEVDTTLTLFNRSRNEIHGALARIIPYYNSLGWRMRQELPGGRQLLQPIAAVAVADQHPANPPLQNHERHARCPVPPCPGRVAGQRRSGAAVDSARPRLRLDFYAPENPNFNWAVIAEAGSGKSFLLQRLQMDYVSLGCKVWNIDSGGSSARACMISGGEVLSLHREQD